MRLSLDFSAEILKARREKDDIFKVNKEKKKSQPWDTISGKLYFKNKGEIKTFQDKQKLKPFITTIPASQELLKGVL